MSEREFIIQEAQGHSPYFVKESELKRRCFEMCSIYYNTHCEFNWDRLKSIILHGEVEKYDEKPWPGPDDIIKMRRGEKGEENSNMLVCDYCGKRFKESEFYDDRCLSCAGKQPSPARTRAEWELWIQDMPYEVTIDSWENWQLDMQQWFRSMPIVPKE